MGEIADADVMDRISELPPFIIHHIMSYLSAKELVQISILSKTWKYLSESYPFLDFDQTYFVLMKMNHIKICYWSSNTTFRKQLKKFMKFVDGSLDRFCQTKFSMQRFRLSTSLVDEGSSSRLHRWIRLAVENGVKELDFNVMSAKSIVYTLPRIIFDAELLTTLKLVGCKMKEPFDTIRLPSLKKLTLERVCINEEMIQRLTTECPFLEDMSFSSCSGLKHFCVSKPLKLKILIIRLPSDIELESVEIAVQSLQILDLSIPLCIGQPRVIDIARCPNLQTIKFINVSLTDQEFNHLISKSHLLEALYVVGCASLEMIMISSSRLKILDFSECHKLKAIDVDTPNLLSFFYSNNTVPTSSINAPCRWRVAFNNEGDPDTPWFLNIKEFLSDSSQIKDLCMTVKAKKVSFNVDNFRESSSSLPCEVRDLFLYVDVPRSDYVALLDGLLCICYPKALYVPTYRETQRKFIEWLFEELMNRDKNCCISHHMKCWRHYLKALTIESCVPFKNPEPLDLDNLMEVWHNLMKMWPEHADADLVIHLDWCFHVPTENA